MTDHFDPYYAWLSIPPKEQPANHYRLLGLSLFEDDPEVISNAADRQMMLVRTYQNGPNGDACHSILNELSQARLSLLEAEAKQVYDQQLRAKTHPKAPPRRATRKQASRGSQELAAKAAPEGDLTNLFEAVEDHAPGSTSPRRTRPAGSSKKTGLPLPALLGLGVTGLALLVALSWIFLSGKSSTKPGNKSDAAGKGNEVSAGGGPKLTSIPDLRIPPGAQARVVLQLKDPVPGVTFTLMEGPRGSELDQLNGEFRWQSTRKDADKNRKVVVRANHPSHSSDIARFQIRVDDAKAKVDLLSLIDPALDDDKGKWSFEDKTLLVADARGDYSIQIPYRPPSDYQVTVDLEKKEGLYGFSMGLLSGSSKFRAYLGGRKGSGLEQVDNLSYARNETHYAGSTFQTGRTSQVIYRVHPKGVRVTFDGRVVIDWTGPAHRLSLASRGDSPDRSLLSFACHRTIYHINRAELDPAPPEFDAAVKPPPTKAHRRFRYEGHDYQIILEPVTWRDAQDRCQEAGGHLACINTGQEQRLVQEIDRLTQSLAPETILWLGATDEVKEGEWRWVTGEPFDFSAWDSEQPSHSRTGQNYLSVRLGDHRCLWRAAVGTELHGYLCEWNRGKPYDIPKVASPKKPKPELKRRPIPAAVQQEKLLAQIESQYQSQAAVTQASQILMARRLLAEARNLSDDSDKQFVLLRASRDFAYRAGETELMLAAIDEVRNRFEPYDAPKQKLSGLKALAEVTKDSKRLTSIVRALLALVDEALADDQYETALNAANGAYELILKAGNGTLRKTAFDRRKQVESIGESFKAYQAALTALKSGGDQPSDHLIVGRWRCLRIGKWEEGLSHLAQGVDGDLKALAQQDLEIPKSAEDQLALADLWWSLANREVPSAREHLRTRARHWYRIASPHVKSYEKRILAESRLEANSDEQPVDLKGLFSGRKPVPKRVLLELAGGSNETEAAVAAALKWLANQQESDGGWSFTGGKKQEARHAATAMALLPFLAAGQTHHQGLYKRTVGGGLGFLMKRMKVTNKGGSLHERGGSMYSHAMATMALCEAYAMTKDKSLLAASQAAVNYIVYAQDPTGGGWRYNARQRGDTSATGWQVTALKIAHEAKLNVPPMTATLSERFLDSVQRGDDGTSYGYDNPVGGTTATSTAGMLCRIYLGWERKRTAVQASAEAIAKHGPVRDNMYYNYYGTQVVRHYGGAPWKEWNSKMKELLLPSQSKDEGNLKGSWYLGGRWAEEGGRLYSTSLATIMLEAYYRHLPSSPVEY